MAVWRTKRNLENSLLKFLTENVSTDWTGVNVGLSFNYNSTPLPAICLRLNSATHKKMELGATTLFSTSLLIIDLYCKGDGQLLDLSQYLLDLLKGGFAYYEYSPNPADKDNPLKVKNGYVYCSIVGDVSVDLGVDADEKDKHRQRITCELQRNKG